MAQKTFKAMVVRHADDDSYTRQIEARSVDELPAGEVLIKVHYSSLNYKDALSASGHRGVTRNYPHTPGIDAAGIVEESSSDDFAPGDQVVATGYDLGMNTAGGFAQYIRVPAAWLVALPENLSLKESMVYGTAGFTAALSLLELEKRDLEPDRGEVLVTGATGGVGCLAVGLLARAGYQVVASTGKIHETQFLMDLGAREVIPRDETNDTTGKPLLNARWAGVVDTVGGPILATAIKSTRTGGVVTCCGLVASHELSTTVYPFILRGTSLVGINSVDCPMPVRLHLWQKMAREWKLDHLERLSSTCALEELEGEIERILQGAQRGRVVVDLKKQLD